MYHNPCQIGNNSNSGRVIIHILCHMRAMNTPRLSVHMSYFRPFFS